MRITTAHTFRDELLNIYGDISSNTVRVSKEGLTDLRHALTVHSDQKLSDKAYQRMYEVLFGILSRDKAIYVRTSKKVELLELASSSLRTGVQHGVKELRTKTVKLLIQHITSIVQHPHGGLCEPLKIDHIRSLRTILEFAPHVENLSRGDWVDLVEFCCKTILADTNDGEDVEEVQGETPNARSARAGSRPALSRDSSSISRVSVIVNSKLKTEIEEVLVCLQLLLQSPNAPIMQPEFKLEKLAKDAVMSFLRTHKILTSAHVAAYTSLNCILSTVSTNNIRLARSVAIELPRLIGRPWESKPGPVLKEEIIVSLMYLLPHIRAYIRDLKTENDEKKLENIREVLDNLLDSFLKGYTESGGKITAEQLQLDEIDFPDPSLSLDTSTSPLTLLSFSLRTDDSTRSELAWMILQIMAMIVSMLDMNASDHESVDAMDTEDSQGSQSSDSGSRRKRRRKTERSKIQYRFDQILQQASSSSVRLKTVALQLIPFLLEEKLRRLVTPLTVPEWRRVMADLSLIASEDSTVNSNWAILGIASGAFLPPAIHPSNASFWEQTWQLCSRQISNQSTCRTACHLMRVILSKDLVIYSHISKSIDDILVSMDLNGPAMLVDSSLDLCGLILEKRNRVTQSLLFQPGERIIRWFISRWRPVDGLDRSTVSTAHLNPAQIARLLSFCLGGKGVPNLPARRYCGTLARAWTKCIGDTKLLNYLLLEDEELDPQHPVKLLQPATTNFTPILTPDHHRTFTALLNDFFEREAGNIDERWHSLMKINANNIVPSVLQNLASFLLTTTAVITTGNRELGISDSLRSMLNSIRTQLIGYLRRRDCTEAHVNAVVDLLSPVLPNFRTVFDSGGITKDTYSGVFGETLRSISTAVESWLLAKAELNDDGDVDMDDFDVPVRIGGTIAGKEPKSVPREALEAAHSADADRNSSIITLNMLSWAHENNAMELSKHFSEYVTQLPTERLLLLKPVVSDVLNASLVLADDAAGILEHLAEAILQKYEFRFCETAMDFVLSAVDALVPMWIQSGSSQDLVYICGRIYDWLSENCLEKDTASHTVRMAMSRTLLRILKIDKAFDAGEKSARTYFVSLLQDKDIRIKLMMAETVPQLFEIFPLNHHLDLYKDIHAHLDKDVRSVERLALRLYTLSRLATASHATKRRVVWYIFETSTLGENDLVGKEGVERYATTCVNSLAKALGLKNARSLFKAFSSQLIFTWLHAYGLDRIPFKVSGYSTRVELLEDMKEELVAQLLMNYSEDDAADLAGHVGISYEDLLSLGFHRIMAYCTAWAIATPPLDDAPKLPPIDARLRKRLGDAEYNRLYNKSFPRIVATLFQVMEQDGTFQKLLSRDPVLVSAKHIMADIVSISASEAPLVEPLKPTFKVKVVLNAFWHICRKGGYDDGKVWNPAIFTYVARKLFNTIDPSLGPLHACAVIRKIRLLVCLAGKTVHEGYPLEMLLHGLRPFIVDIICAQDTVGIVQYLFINGRPYLETNPTFVISTFLSIMASLRTFIATSPNSQIDSSQFRGSQGTAQSFHSWLCDYLSDYNSPALSKPNAETFKAIVDSAIGFKSHGNAFHGTKEGELLQVLLRDEAEEDGLLDEASRRLAFSLISSHFEKPQTYREDLYGADNDSIHASKALLRTCRKYNVSNEYLLWSARVLGRAYAASGTIHAEWTREAELPKVVHLPRDPNALEIMPKAAILKHLTELLFSEDRQEAGLAEITLNDILEQETQGGEQTLTSELIVSMHHLRALALSPPENPPSVVSISKTIALAGIIDNKSVDDWVTELAITISLNSPSNAVGSRVGPLLQSVNGLAVKVFPYLVHLVLILEAHKKQNILRRALSDVFRHCFRERLESTLPHMMVLINTVVYLRAQQREYEKTKLDRDAWLDLDFHELASAACKCKMYKTALMFVEIHCSREKTDYTDCTNLLLEIYKNIDDPDSYYGLNQSATIHTVLSKLEYEQNGWKSLNFRGAQMESSMRLESGYNAGASVGAIRALNTLGLYGLSHSFLQGGLLGFGNEETLENVYESAWKLEQWNLPCPTSYNGQAPIIYRALQTVNNTINATDVSTQIDSSFLEAMKQVTTSKQTGPSLEASIRTLAMLTEVEEVLASRNSVELQESWIRMELRTPWMKIASFSDVEEMMAIRQATFSSIAKRPHLQERANIDLKVARLYEAKALITVCELSRSHKILQHALSASTHLNKVSNLCAEVALDISAATTLQTASVLWDQGEAISSIGMLQGLEDAKLDIIRQDISVGRAELLGKLGCWISEARLEKPEIIMAKYHETAITQLSKEKNRQEVAGRVYHEFALFCDRQLNNQSSIEEIERAAKLREKKQAEIQEAEKQIQQIKQNHPNFQKLKSFQGKAERWLSLDDMEYSRLRENREAFLERSIGNYLKSLEVCDDYDQDAIRFCSLWLQYSANEKANKAASSSIDRVESRKFIPLMNQLSSRMLNQEDDFQSLLMALILRICRDHPYHGLYQILSVKKTETKDLTSRSRSAMALKILMTLKQEDKFAGNVMNRLHQSITTYVKAAAYEMKTEKRGPKMVIKRGFVNEPGLSQKIEKEIPALKLPPPTMNIQVRLDCDYSRVPYLQRFNPEFSIATGLSAPKILTCQDSAGHSYKMLVKGGNDDLRQDTIMEQVFEHVSNLLQRNRQTRQRDLGIRTYKVLPLGVGAGIIEFVPNTIPLHEYLIPAHTQYYPKEYPFAKCSSAIRAVSQSPREVKLQTFEKILKNYSPVMRYFFMHHFEGPDEWFRSRLAYTRSSAAISILGWVLGLGDRHGHNILIDEKSGEVVHIDLGVAFEQGRVLPIPETVPFRLTRDIIDGMGVTGTEGVFRRCCEFTLSVLRIEKDNITTILDVLRYDPLYNWTLSPIKLQKMQRGNDEVNTKDETDISDADIFVKPNQSTNNDAEAERALGIVDKKLSGTLSVGATVNELIQQATDVKNLAVLFAGWGAWV